MTWTCTTYHLEWGALLLSCGFRDIQALYSIEPLQVWWCTGLPFLRCFLQSNQKSNDYDGVHNLSDQSIDSIMALSFNVRGFILCVCSCPLDDLFCSLSIHVFFGQLIIALHNLHVIIFFYFIDLFWFGVTWFRVLSV